MRYQLMWKGFVFSRIITGIIAHYSKFHLYTPSLSASFLEKNSYYVSPTISWFKQLGYWEGGHRRQNIFYLTNDITKAGLITVSSPSTIFLVSKGWNVPSYWVHNQRFLLKGETTLEALFSHMFLVLSLIGKSSCGIQSN